MSNSTTQLDLISASQANKEVTANALFDALSPAIVYGRRASTTAGLTWGYYGGMALVGETPIAIANGTLSLVASTTNYVEASASTGAVSVNTSGFSAGARRLYTVVTGSATVTSYTDHRTTGGGGGVGSGDIAAAIEAHEAAANPHPQYLTQAEGDALYAAASAITAAINAHVAASDPHPTYLTQTEGDARYLQSVGAQPFDVHAFYPGVPSASAIVLRVPVARAVAFANNFSGSYARASVAATGSTVFDVQKNGVSIGSITFAAGATSGTFTTSGTGVSFAAGDILLIVGPNTADATLANVGIVLAGTR